LSFSRGWPGRLRRIRRVARLLTECLGLTPPVMSVAQAMAPSAPEGFKAACIVSADLELNWAWQWARSGPQRLAEAEQHSRRTRQNVPQILRYSEQYGIPITWATVGHLFLDSCARKDGRAHPDLPRLSHFENEFWRFDGGDWFEDDPACWWEQAKGWYAPDLVRAILSGKTQHEIACHTFSHIDCRDGVCPPDVLRAEIAECRRAAAPFGLALTSFVHPAHTIGNLPTLAACGFASYRSDRDILGFAVDRGGIWELPSTAQIVWYEGLPAWAQRLRYIRIAQKAVATGRLCCFWFHPSDDSLLVDRILDPLFGHLQRESKAGRLWVGTARAYCEFLAQRGAAIPSRTPRMGES